MQKSQEERLAEICLEFIDFACVAFSIKGLGELLHNTINHLRSRGFKEIDFDNISFELTLGFLCKKHIEDFMINF